MWQLRQALIGTMVAMAVGCGVVAPASAVSTSAVSSPAATRSITVPREEIQRIVERQLEARLQTMADDAGKPARLWLDQVQVPQDVVLSTGIRDKSGAPVSAEEITWQVKIAERNLQPGRQTMQVIATVPQRPPVGISVMVVLKQKMNYVTLRRAVPKGEVITADDLAIEVVESNHMARDWVPEQQAESLVGRVARRAIAAGLPVHGGWFEQPRVVERGSRVRVIARRDALLIETLGVAMTAGRVGEMIEVQNPKSQHRFVAQVTAAGEVTVLF